MVFDQITLPNGLRIVGERIPHFRSVSVGLWVGAAWQKGFPNCTMGDFGAPGPYNLYSNNYGLLDSLGRRMIV